MFDPKRKETNGNDVVGSLRVNSKTTNDDIKDDMVNEAKHITCVA